jgi:hypothetical protein
MRARAKIRGSQVRDEGALAMHAQNEDGLSVHGTRDVVPAEPDAARFGASVRFSLPHTGSNNSGRDSV